MDLRSPLQNNSVTNDIIAAYPRTWRKRISVRLFDIKESDDGKIDMQFIVSEIEERGAIKTSQNFWDARSKSGMESLFANIKTSTPRYVCVCTIKGPQFDPLVKINSKFQTNKTKSTIPKISDWPKADTILDENKL